MLEGLVNVSNGLASVVEKVGPSVVQVNGRRRLPATGIVWSEDGVIVTANHVVRRDEKITVKVFDGQVFSAQLVGRDPSTDLAVLRAEATDFTPATWATADAPTMKVGNLVLALGRPGQSVQATLGIVSALGDGWRTPHGGVIDRYLQTDVLMYPGFSGGPLVDVTGYVLGLNTSAMRGLSLAVPQVTLNRVVSSLLSHGKIRRGYLGVSTQTVRLPAPLAEELQQETGLLLVSVEANSPAEKANLMLGDTIVAVGEMAVRQHDDLLAHLTSDRLGQSIAIRLVRGGALQVVDVVVGERT